MHIPGAYPGWCQVLAANDSVFGAVRRKFESLCARLLPGLALSLAVPHGGRAADGVTMRFKRVRAAGAWQGVCVTLLGHLLAHESVWLCCRQCSHSFPAARRCAWQCCMGVCVCGRALGAAVGQQALTQLCEGHCAVSSALVLVGRRVRWL